MVNVALREPWTVDRFLTWEDKQEGHQRLVGNLLRVLEDALDPSRFDVVPEMRLRVAGRVRYPDVSVAAGRIPDDARTLHDALVLFEVLSDDTAATDREIKRVEYASLPGLQSYVLVEQSARAATVLRRAGEDWTETTVTREVDLPELGVTLPLDSIYRCNVIR